MRGALTNKPNGSSQYEQPIERANLNILIRLLPVINNIKLADIQTNRQIPCKSTTVTQQINKRCCNHSINIQDQVGLLQDIDKN